LYQGKAEVRGQISEVKPCGWIQQYNRQGFYFCNLTSDL
jgi:hypothetical protein